jgi:hypothetical protein
LIANLEVKVFTESGVDQKKQQVTIPAGISVRVFQLSPQASYWFESGIGYPDL